MCSIALEQEGLHILFGTVSANPEGAMADRSDREPLVSSQDVFEHAAAIHGWRMEYMQLSPGPFYGRLSQINLDHFQIIRERTNRVVIKSGASWPGSIVISLPLEASENGYLLGHPLPAYGSLMTDGNELPELRTPAQLDLLCIAFSREWFAIKAVEMGYQQLSEQVWRAERLVIPDVFRLPLCNLLVAFLNEACSRPQMIAEAACRASFEDSLCDLLLTALSGSQITVGLSATHHKRVADEVRHLVMYDPSEVPTLAEVCAQLSISRAHLQNCFKHSYGVTASLMLRSARLHGVRREFRQAIQQRKPLSIGDLAARWGFWHWSRFAADYKRQFGELPSETLRRYRFERIRDGRSDFG